MGEIGLEYDLQLTGMAAKIESGARCDGMMWGQKVQLNPKPRAEVAEPFVSPGLELAGFQSSLFGNTRSIYRCRSDSQGRRAENHSLSAVGHGGQRKSAGRKGFQWNLKGSVRMGVSNSRCEMSC